MCAYRRKLEKQDLFLNHYIIHYILMSFNFKTAFYSFYLTVVCILSSDLPLNLFQPTLDLPDFHFKTESTVKSLDFVQQIKIPEGTVYLQSVNKSCGTQYVTNWGCCGSHILLRDSQIFLRNAKDMGYGKCGDFNNVKGIVHPKM